MHKYQHSFFLLSSSQLPFYMATDAIYYVLNNHIYVNAKVEIKNDDLLKNEDQKKIL